LGHNSGDACSNYAIGALNGFPTEFYNGALSPIFKFLDLNEVIVKLIYDLVEAILLKSQSSTLSTDDTAFLLGGLHCTYNQFFITVRQQILWMFANSQCLGQFQSYNSGPNRFQSFLCGSNTYPQEPATLLIVPKTFNENMRMLMMKVRPYETKNFNNKRNHITQIPVWGAQIGFQSVNPLIMVGDNPPTFLFQPDVSDPNPPDVWDGTMGNNVADFNATPLMADIITIWNDYMTTLNDQFSGVSGLGGQSSGSPLLQYTRYVTYRGDNIRCKPSHRQRGNVGRHLRPFLKDVETKVFPVLPVLERKSSGMTLDRKLSKDKDIKVEIDTLYAPPTNTPFSEWTLAYSGMIPITDTLREYFPNLILPIVEIGDGSLPNQSQFQVSVLEPYSIATNVNIVNTLATRGSELLNAIPDDVLGRSGQQTELSKFVDELSKTDQGGFLGDLFAVVGGIANTIGI